MDYKKYELGNLNLHIIKTDKFKTVNVRVTLKRKIIKDEINYRNLLSSILLESSKKYPSRRELQMKKEDLYNVIISSASFKSGAYTFLSYSLSCLNEKYTEKGMLEKSINLLLETLLNPDVNDGKFNPKSFNFVKSELKDYLISLDENPNTIASIRLEEEMGKNTPLEYSASGYLDTLDDITEKSLYEYYKSVVEDDIIDIFVIGDVDSNKIIEIFKNSSFRKKQNLKSESHFVTLEKNRNFKEIIENKGFIQSKLLMGYQIDDMTEFERKYVLNAYNFILGGGNDSKLFREVREKNSLCYSISSSYSILYNDLVVSAGIDKNNYQKTVNLIKEAFKEIEQGHFKDSDLDEVKIIYQNACKKMYDNPFDIIRSYLLHEYFDNDLIEERIKNIEKVTKEDIITLAKKIKLDTIYFLEGGSDEQEEN